MNIRLMRTADLDPVVDMLRTSFAPRLTPYMTHTQHGIRAFLESCIAHPALFPSLVLAIAADHRDSPIGFAEYSTDGTSAHLAYLCVAEQARRGGVASALLDYFAETHEPDDLSLDVFVDNEAALRLYEKHGFEFQKESVWVVRPAPRASTPLGLDDAHESLAMHALYGFCNLHVSGRVDARPLGRMGSSVLRCYDTETFCNEPLLSSVKATIPGLTECFLIVERPATRALSAPGATALTATRRLRRPRVAGLSRREDRA